MCIRYYYVPKLGGSLVSAIKILLFLFVGRRGRVLVIGVWLGTYIGGIVILVIGYIGLGLGFVIRGILFCLLGGCTCGLGIFPHCI